MTADDPPPGDPDRTASGSSGGSLPPPPAPPLERPGDEVGPYRLVSVLGEGAFGTVWLAERRHPFVQSVAIKLVRPGMDSRAVLARFEQERQTLAVLNHPNVARVLDGGLTARGRPFFAMEHVRGEPITDFCNRKRLDLRERLGLFRQVCEAVQHAHTKGIIHRDLKPSNILVTLDEGDRPVAKVIDFGIAKAVTGRMTDGTLMTESGLMIGTPAYMSPEQAQPGLDDIDTRTDVYSLGVVLYELLTGLLPFDPKDLRKQAYHEVQRIIREEDPPSPSSRLTTVATRDADLANRIGTARRESTAALAATLKRELEWIPLKAMRKERKERYATPGDLARDVENYLEGRPLVAAPESTAYRLRKYFRRNRGFVAAASIVLAALVVGLGLATWQWREASMQRDAADAARIEADRARELAVESERQAVAEKEVAQAARDEAARERDAANAARETVEANAYIANIRIASSWLEQGFPGRARALLDACPPPRRGWEWAYLCAQADRSLARIDLGETEPIGVRFTPDSRKLVVNGRDGTVSVVDLARGETVRSIEVDPAPGESSLLALSPDGTRFIRTVEDGPPRMYEVETGRFLHELRGFETVIETVFDTGIETLDFSTDGSIVLATAPGLGQAWRAADGTPVRTFRSEQAIVPVRFNPDGRSVLWENSKESYRFEMQEVETGDRKWILGPESSDYLRPLFSPDGREILFDVHGSNTLVHDATDGSRLREIKIGLIARGSCLSPGGDRLATFDTRRGLVTVDLVKGKILARRAIESPYLAEGSATFSPDGRRLYTLRPDGTLVVSDVTTGAIIATIPGAEGNQIALGPDGFRAVVPGRNSLRIMDLATVLPLPDFPGRITTSPSGETVLVHVPERIEDSQIMLRKTNGEVLVALEGVKTAIASAMFSADGHRILTVSTARSGRLHDVRDGRLIADLSGRGRDITAAAFHPDGSLIATGSRDGTIRLWNGRTGAPLAELAGHTATVHCVSFSPDGSVLASGAADGTVRLWDPLARAARATLGGHPGEVLQVRFSPDGRLLGTLTDRDGHALLAKIILKVDTSDPVARIWDVSSGNLQRTLEIPAPERGARVTSIDFSPDSRRAVVAGEGVLCSVFDLADGRKVLDLGDGTSEILAARFHPDGSRIAALTDDHRLWIFDARSGAAIVEFDGFPGAPRQIGFSPDGTRLEITPNQVGTSRILDAVPHRIRFAERRLRAAGRSENLGSSWLAELRGGSPPTWLTDPGLAVHRPDLSGGSDDDLIRQAEEVRIVGLLAKSRRERLSLATTERRWDEAISIAFEAEPAWMNPRELSVVAQGASVDLPAAERDAQLDRLLTLATLAAEKSRRKDPDILDTLARIHWQRGEKDRAIEIQQETIAVTEARPEAERRFGHDMDLRSRRRTLLLYQRLDPGAELPAEEP